MFTKKYYLVFDCEGTDDLTLGERDNQLPYDLSAVVIDREGAVVDEFAFLVKDVFTDCDLMNSAYYKRKMPEYLDRLAEGTIQPVTVQEVFANIAEVIDRWNVSDLWAYNVGYDYQAIANLYKKYRRKRNFPHDKAQAVCDLNPRDIMLAAVETLCGPQKYYKFCVANGYFSKRNNVNYGAEIVYRFITGNTDFIEEHKGIDDARIESEILVKVFQTKKKIPQTVAPNYFYKRVNARVKHTPARRERVSAKLHKI